MSRDRSKAVMAGKNEKADYTALHPITETLLTLIIGGLVSICAAFFLDLSMFEFHVEHVFNIFFFERPFLSFIQIAVMLVLFLWITCLTRSRFVTALIILLGVVLLGIGNHLKRIQRGEPVYPSDLTMINELPFLVDMVELKVAILAGLSLLLVAAVIVFHYVIKWKRRRKSDYKKFPLFISRILVFSTATCSLIFIYNFNHPGNLLNEIVLRDAHWLIFNQSQNYQNNGFVTGFLFNLNSPAMEIPENYSREKVEETVRKYEDLANEINESRNGTMEDTNIVYIMNESFSDPLKIEGITTADDPLQMTREIMENHTSGEVLSQGLGGGTANIEFEALTGISLEVLNASISTPYIQLENQIKHFPSIVSYLANLDYRTTAIHPFNATMYKRTNIYQNMGFDSFLIDETMTFNDKIENNRYISDESAYQEVQLQMENSPESDFVHLVTMQNHNPYEDKYPNTEVEASGAMDRTLLVNYIQDLIYSDQAIGDFIEALDTSEEKTMVIFWGDHLPGFYDNETISQNGKLVTHQTPLFMYTNFDENNDELGTISPIYFVNHVLETAGLKVSPFHALLMALEEELPAFERGMYLERGSEELISSRNDLSKSTLELLNEYEVMLYDLMTGGNYAGSSRFFEE